jgi:hypothetical protein
MLLFTVAEASRRIRQLNSTPISIEPKSQFYLNLRFYGENFYDTFQDSCSDAYHVDYVIPAFYQDFDTAKKSSILVKVPLRRDELKFNGYLVETYGRLVTVPAGTVVVDKVLIRAHPCLLSSPRAKSSR